METVDRTRSTTSSLGSRDHSLAAPIDRKLPKGGVNSTATSVAGSDRSGDGDGLPSSDGTFDKLRRGSDDTHSETSSNRRKMSKLFKGRRKSRRKSMQDDMLTGDTGADVPPLPDMPDIRPHGNDSRFHSEESLGLHKSVTSSLLTEDLDLEPSPARPGISPHQSHAGYLTLSSPLITSETVDSVAQSDATLVGSATSADELPTPRQAKTFDIGASKRGVSPVGKLKEAFNPSRRSTSPKAAAGDTTDGTRPATSGGLGALFGGKKRETKILDDTPLQLSPPQIHSTKETQSTPSLIPNAPKRIITQIPATPPNAIEAPTTLVTPPTPTDARPASPAGSTASSKQGSSQPNSNVVVSPSGNMISHRRARSATNPPSKLSNSISAPLSPTPEETKTPGGTAVPPQAPSGFFSSVFSAAQNAASSLSTIANSAATNKSKTTNQQKQEGKQPDETNGEEEIASETAEAASAETEKRKLAVETLGSGNLSLAQLGFSDSENTSPMASQANIPMKPDEASARAEDMAAAQAVSAAYAAEKPPTETERPRALTATSNASAGPVSPPRQTELMDSPAPSLVQRQGSIRSRISGGRRRRHRGSSATTGHTIAAAIGASTSTLAPQAAMSGQRLNGTGFAVASPKRNRDFHNLFKSVPEDDYLIEDYSAALQKEILLHGRLYVSEGHLCFSSNIFGWVTNSVISFDEVVSVEKKSTAVVFPNAIVIQTLHARNVFASFLTRDSTYDLIIGIWKISHPNLKSSLNGVALDGTAGTGDKTEKAESVASEDGSDQESDDEVYDEDAEEEEGMSFTEAGDVSAAGSDAESAQGDARKVSGTVAQAVSGGPSKLSDGAEAAVNGAAAAQDFPGAVTHAPTECGDNDQHFDKPLIDTTIPAPLGKVYSMMWGPTSGVFMRKWLVEDQRSADLQMEDDGKGLGESRKAFTYSYIKPLPGSIGPRQTKCNISATLEQFDLEKAVVVLCSTQTPDVPSGSIFLTKTRYCLMWGPNNSTRLIMTFTVEWSGKSWLKGPIEKGASEGQMSYATSLTNALRNAVASKTGIPRGPTKPGKGKKRAKALPAEETAPAPAPAPETAQAKKPDWGLLEPVRSLLGPIADIIDPLFTTQGLVLLLTSLLIYSWFFRAAPAYGSTHLSAAQREVAYEEIWRAEEADLWTWLEERVALDRAHSAAAGGRVFRAQKMQSKLVAEGMRERQIDEAIRTTEEKLRELKGKVKREREVARESLKETNS